MSGLTLSLLEHVVACLFPRPHYSAWPIRFGSRGPSEPSSDTSPKCINREGLGKRRTGTIGNAVARLFVTQTFISVDEIPWCHQTTPLGTIYFLGFYKTNVNFLFCGEGGLPQLGVKGLRRLHYLLTSIFLCSDQRCLHRCWFCFLLLPILKRFFTDEQERLYNWPLQKIP